jgi:hypothetical protein
MTYELIKHDVIDRILVQISLARSQKIDDEAHNMLNSAQLMILENRMPLNEQRWALYDKADMPRALIIVNTNNGIAGLTLSEFSWIRRIRFAFELLWNSGIKMHSNRIELLQDDAQNHPRTEQTTQSH